MVATSLVNSTPLSMSIRFQSAFHRGNGCYPDHTLIKPGLLNLSVRFSSRQWLLLMSPFWSDNPHLAFSPLFIAAMVATQELLVESIKHKWPFSPLFIAAMVAT